MQFLAFETKLCKPRHPFTKGKVERLVRFVKDNFLADQVFCDLTDLNWQALEWCNKQNGTYRRTVDGSPQKIHETVYGEQLRMVPEDSIQFYLCPERKIFFDGFVNYDGRRFGEGQYESLAQPEEFPTAPVQTQIFQLSPPSGSLLCQIRF